MPCSYVPYVYCVTVRKQYNICNIDGAHKLVQLGLSVLKNFKLLDLHVVWILMSVL